MRSDGVFALGIAAGVMVAVLVGMLVDRTSQVLPACQTPMSAVSR